MNDDRRILLRRLAAVSAGVALAGCGSVTDPGPRDDGLRADYVDGEFVDSRLSVTGDPFVLTESRLDRRNVTATDGSVLPL